MEVDKEEEEETKKIKYVLKKKGRLKISSIIMSAKK
jgi:hypothetical protein